MKDKSLEIEIEKFNKLKEELISHLNISGNTSDSAISFLLTHIIKLQIEIDKLKNKECNCSNEIIKDC